MEYADVRLDLYQRDKYTSEYVIQLIRFNDEILVPDNNFTASLPIFQSFWKNQVRPLYTNTLVPTDHRVNQDLKGKHSVIWEKTYKLKEKLNDADSFTCKRVNIFKKIQKVLRYNENPQSPTMTTDNPETNIYSTSSTGTSTNLTRPKDRIYMIIKAKQTIDANTVNGNDLSTFSYTDIHSYNIFFKSKHVTPQAGV